MKLQTNRRIREGKAKILFETDQPEFIIQHFKDDATAFNAQKRGTIHNKGIINNQITAWIFPFLEKKGIPTHFVERLTDRDMCIRAVEIIPVETVVRNRAAGSICKKLGIPKGQPFETPLVEYFYKSDELGDPPIGETHIFQFGWASADELKTIHQLALRVNQHLSQLFASLGMNLIDFKLEFGRDKFNHNRVILADEFTPDGCRLWDSQTGEPMDKDRFRQDLGGVEEAYVEVFQRLKKYFEGNA